MKENLQKRIRLYISVFIIGLILSGITAFPIQSELDYFNTLWQHGSFISLTFPNLALFLDHIKNAVHDANAQYPQLFYGTDWLAFAHIVIATAFIGPWRNPIKNIWVIEFGMIACMMVIPLAMICGPIRSIPFYWRVIDCSFGLFGIIPLYYVRSLILQLEKQS
jgi:hypothetical protein